MKLNINGYAQHGKDTVADMFVDLYGLKKVHASILVAKDILEEGYLGPYESVEACYEDRVNHRQEWFEFIRAKAREDVTHYVRKTLETGDVYVGHRGLEEFLGTQHLFDATIWVNASARGVPKENPDSCELDPEIHHDFYIENNDLEDTIYQVKAVHRLIQNKERAFNAY